MKARELHAETGALAVTQPTAADYSRELEGGVAWLRFAAPVEEEFRRSHVLRFRPKARFWQLLQLVVGLFGVRLVLGGVARDEVHGLLLACSAAHVTVSAVLAGVAFGRAYARSYLPITASLTPVRTAAFAVIIAAIIDNGGGGTAALAINMFGLLFFSGLLLRQALPAAAMMIGAFLAALAFFGVPTPVAAYAITSVLVVVALAGFVAWDTQRAARIAFLEHGLTRADATRDALTGLANRRHFDARLATMWKAAGDSGRSVTVLLVDVDHFKAYNDHYGHQAGDEALRAVARTLASEAGKTGLVARIGGEEMAFVGGGLGVEEAKALAERLRRAVEALDVPHAGAPEAGTLTVSIGGACLVPFSGRSVTGALQLADQNLYAAKRHGRNRVVFREDEYAAMQTGRFIHGGRAKAP